MKFLCIPCDSPMRLQTVGPPEGGSLSVVYSCPECGYEMAMLTNAYETQIVQSLGVRIGPDPDLLRTPAVEGHRPGGDETERTDLTSGTGCPFAAMIPGMEGAPVARPGQAGEPIPVRWTAAAEARLEKVPAFVRPMARAGIERFARDKGSLEVDEKILDAARDYFGM